MVRQLGMGHHEKYVALKIFWKFSSVSVYLATSSALQPEKSQKAKRERNVQKTWMKRNTNKLIQTIIGFLKISFSLLRNTRKYTGLFAVYLGSLWIRD